MRRALLAVVIVLATDRAAWGQPVDRQILLRVLLATDARQVAACQRLGIVSDTSPEDLRKKILRAGGNAGFVTFDPTDPDKMNAEVYRCPPAAAAARSPAAPPAVAPRDPESVHRMLLGTWSGTLSAPPLGSGTTASPATQLPASVRMWDEGGQLRWAMEVGQDLQASGAVTHYFGDITLTGTYGERAQPITYSLRLNGPTLEGGGAGQDQIVRTLSLRKQP
ncbi:MAG: hypothetical protein ACREK6_17635 [Candidatus Rokuibacteriota bacterium]